MTEAEKRLEQIRSLTEALKREGFQDICYYMIRTQRVQISVFPGDSIRQEEMDDTMYSIEASYQGKKSRMYTNHPEETKRVIQILKESSEVYGQAENAGLIYDECTPEDISFSWNEPEEIIPVIKKAWEKATDASLVFLVQKCCYEQNFREIWMIDEQMHRICDVDGYHCFNIRIAAGKDGTRSSAADCIYGKNLQTMEIEHCVDRVICEAQNSLGGEKLLSGRYSVILGGNVAAELLEAFLPAFYAENLQRDDSPLKGKWQEQIASPGIWMREIPGFDKGRIHRTVDDEGIPVTEKALIRNGIFVQQLYNRKTAQKDGVPSTGNGFRPSVQSDVETGITNVVLGMKAEQTSSRSGLEMEMAEGILVTQVDGVFAGADSTTGKFSLIAGGRVVRNGREAETFREVTISGDFFECLGRIKKAGNELYTTEPGAMSVLAPDLWIGELTISGK